MTVFLDKNIYAPAGGYLAEHAEVVTDFEHPEKLDAIICRARPITRELIEQCPNLKVIARHGVGVDSVDVECATQRRIAVINALTSNADSVAELVVALFLMLSRMLYEANVKSRESSFEKKAPANFRGLEMNGKVFGQIGMGNIAQRVARIMHNGFGCKVLGYDPFISAEDALYDTLCICHGGGDRHRPCPPPRVNGGARRPENAERNAGAAEGRGLR